MPAGRRGEHQTHAVAPSSAPATVQSRPPPSTIDNGRWRRSDSSQQPHAAPAMLFVRPVHMSRSSAMRAVNELPPDREVRTAVLQLASPVREPFFRGGENQSPSLASAFFPSDEKVSQRAGERLSEGRDAKGLSWLQWLMANFLILLVAATVVLALFGPRMFAGSERQVGTTAGFVVLPEAHFRKPPPVVLPRPMHREAENDGRKRNLPPKTSGKSTRRRTIDSFKKVTRSR
ncbi:hypothetical protein MRX96_032940 [Rhipicephalus microplus]